MSGAELEAWSAHAPARRRRRRLPLLIALCAAFLVVLAVCAIAGTLLAPHDPDRQDLLAGLQGPGSGHLLGTDDSGRDILSRLIAGVRPGVLGPLLVALGAAAIGTVLGLSAGYRGGWLDTLVMRGVDLVLAMPALLVAIVLLGVLGGGYYAAVAVLILFMAPSDTRIVRGATLEHRSLPYVDAARTTGLSPWRIMLRHIWPNLLPLVAANAFLNFAYGLVSLSALSFLGFGGSPGEADWGRMLSDGIQFIESNPLVALAPGAMILLTATSMNLLGDWAYEWLSDRGRAR